MFSEKDSFYFIGIGGVSMSALACLLKDRGFSVRGSDVTESRFTLRLRKRGISVSIGEEEEISENIVVYTGAVGQGHPQYARAEQAGKRLMARAELLGKIAEEYPHVISVAGCHGKTTATSMLSHVFARSRRGATCHIGGEDLSFGNYYHGGEDYFLTEACEFQRSFLRLNSETAIILNVDLDHTDCYGGEKDLLDAYRQFAAQAERVIVNADDARARSLPHALSFGAAGEISAEKLRADGERYSFLVTERGIPLIGISLSVVGKVHVYNALAAFAAARLYGFSAEEIKLGLESFRGVKRRFEWMGEICGAPAVCDYAHHPREIAAAFSTAQKICKGTVRLVFQPHTYTRTRDLMGEFSAVLKKAENPIIYKTYAAREEFCVEGSAYALMSRVPEAVYVQTPEQLRRRLENARKDDLILILGAGDIYEAAKQILDGKKSSEQEF